MMDMMLLLLLLLLLLLHARTRAGTRTRRHARTQARVYACMRARTLTRTRARTHARYSAITHMIQVYDTTILVVPNLSSKGGAIISIIVFWSYVSENGRYHTSHHYCLACGRKLVRQAHTIISIIMFWPVAPNLLEKVVS